MTEKLRNDISELNLNHVQEKNMFGSLGFMINGKLAMCVRDSNVMYKLGVKRCKELVSQGLAEPVIMGKRMTKDWVYIDNTQLDDPNVYKSYLFEALEFNKLNS